MIRWAQSSTITAPAGGYVSEGPTTKRFDPRAEYWTDQHFQSFRYPVPRRDIPIMPIPEANYFVFEFDQQWQLLTFTHEIFEFDQQWTLGKYITFELLADTLPLADTATFSLYVAMNAITDVLPLADVATIQRFVDMATEEDLLPLSDDASMLLEIIFPLLEDILSLSDEADMLVGTGTNREGWVLNIDSLATGRYAWAQGFNSFTEHDGKFYGCADDGIYELTGDTDAGTAIDAIAVMGQTDFDVPGEKRVRAVYVNARTDGGLFVRVVLDDNVVRTYEVEESEIQELQSRRAVLGRGLRGVNWQFAVGNIDGADAEIDRVTTTPTEFSRRRG